MKQDFEDEFEQNDFHYAFFLIDVPQSIKCLNVFFMFYVSLFVLICAVKRDRDSSVLIRLNTKAK